jgi:hypothetical protein
VSVNPVCRLCGFIHHNANVEGECRRFGVFTKAELEIAKLRQQIDRLTYRPSGPSSSSSGSASDRTPPRGGGDAT